MTSSVSLLAAGGLVAGGGDLVLGLFDPTVEGAGFSSMTFQIDANGHIVLSQTFTTAALAVSYFTDHAIDLGSVATTLPGLALTLTVTSATPGGGFDFGLLLGDPPATETAGLGSTLPHSVEFSAHEGHGLL